MDTPNDPQDLIYALVDLTFATAERTQRLVGRVMTELDLTHSLANALWQLRPDAEAPSMRQLAARLRCDPSTVTFLADRLEQRGLVARRVDAGNRRVKILSLTPAGRELRDKLVAAMIGQSPVARLSQDEQRQLLDLLSKAMAASESDVS